jgi:predicted permease
MMKALRASLLRLIGTFTSARSERELAAELEAHLQLHIDDQLRAGLSPEEARRRAVLALGGIEQTKEAYRERRGLPLLETAIRDVRYGLRALRKSPGFAVAAIVVLGLGIGANAAIFTVVNAVVLRPLPFRDADRIVRLWHTPPPALFTDPVFSLSPANFIDWEAQTRSFEQMAIYRGGRRTITGQGEPDGVATVRGSASLLPIFGLTPTLGRHFTRDEDSEGGARVVILSESFWRSRFGADRGVIGRTLTIDAVPHTIVGVTAAPSFLEQTQLWVPLQWSADDRAVRNNHNYRGVAKLKPGVSVASAQADLTAVSDRLALAYPADNKDWGALVVRLQDDLVGDARTSLLVLLGAVALVLLIACANLANLMLVRTYARAKEIAVRTALGASRRRVVQQLIAEGLLLGAGGGIAGFLFAVYGVEALLTVFGTALPRANEVVVDAGVVVFTTIIALATGAAAALAPAWRLTGRDPTEALKQGPSRGNSSGDEGRVRNLLVVSEVALALMLLIAAGLMVRSLDGLRAVDPGFEPRNLLTATIDIPDTKYPTPEQRNQFFARVLARIRAVPGVVAAAWIDTVPLQGGSTQYVAVEGHPVVQESERPVVAVRLTSPGYFAAARTPLVAGRDFTDADTLGRPAVVVVSERTARRFWPDEDPLGKHLTLTMMTKEAAQVVGVVREVKTGALDAGDAESETAVYAPREQFGFGGSAVVVRTAIAPDALTQPVIAAVRAVDPEQPVLDIQTMERIVDESLGHRPFAMRMFTAFATLALVLACIGIYSVLAYTVGQRVREIGIRMALGAPSRGVLRLVVAEGLKPTIVGVALGLVMAAALVRLMSALLFGVSQYDPWSFGTSAAVVTVVGMLATAIPAYRATQVDPIATLRAE